MASCANSVHLNGVYKHDIFYQTYQKAHRMERVAVRTRKKVQYFWAIYGRPLEITVQIFELIKFIGLSGL